MEKKSKRTSKKQFESYLKFLESSDLLRTGKLKPTDEPKDVQNIWEKMACELNACGDGPIRTTQEWKKVFREWKSAVRKKARKQKELNANEQKLLSLTGTVAVTGFQQITEIGAVVEPQDEPLGTETINYNYELSDAPLNDMPNEEVLIVEVENDADDMPCSSKKGKRNKKTDNSLLTAYQEGQESEREGLLDIAKALNNIAEGIHRCCDLYERKNNISK
ncbi:hypothetical protein NQ317_017439 [Molorchus minor]|uniref:Regulatory protein zeste n=1 Tax=Molorchus minor TaxID=1323400 RepID=A0ABQ9JA63_9CUCU|nr:hypothetical protein NQ317_017439 [Molorchus minor]